MLLLHLLMVILCTHCN